MGLQDRCIVYAGGNLGLTTVDLFLSFGGFVGKKTHLANFESRISYLGKSKMVKTNLCAIHIT